MVVLVVLAYLLSESLPTLPEVEVVDPHHTTTRIIVGVRKAYESNEEQLQRFSNILLDLGKDATFDALYNTCPFRWSDGDMYDTIVPFGDEREAQYQSLWTFDIQNDVLRYTNRDGCSQIPLALLRERAVSLSDMKPLEGPLPLPFKPAFDPEGPYWEPQIKVGNRLRAFTHHLLHDFHHQWRHIHRRRYNSITLRALARAIIRLSTLDFEVRQNTGEGRVPLGLHVRITELPAWEPFENDIVRVGSIYVVLCQHIQEGLSMARRHLSSRDCSKKTASGEAQAQYMVLSVKSIMLCHVTIQHSLECTVPEPLFNGIEPPSGLALDYLIWATASARPWIFTPLQSLPIEIQNIILDYEVIGTLEAAKVGCLLGLGSPFLWKDGPLEVTLEERHLPLPSGSTVESQLWFGEHKSGIVYWARAACYLPGPFASSVLAGK
ncbi:hypothetical protein BU16DRAFT_60318 [Lophium mytilinum]|uniref:Uncharacterized protein n=1 Tax=Lophium mytilinum TaxID=390894 RepID=A0A6A6QNH7_9PEZI|nr:hypothetical protein BU16DRAFT_60318 [Lophium mytilinum]